MSDERNVRDLLKRIEVLQQRAEALEIALDLLQNGRSRPQIQLTPKFDRVAGISGLWNILVVTLYPVVFWLIRRICGLHRPSK